MHSASNLFTSILGHDPKSFTVGPEIILGQFFIVRQDKIVKMLTNRVGWDERMKKQDDLISSCYNVIWYIFLGRPRGWEVSSAISFANPFFIS